MHGSYSQSVSPAHTDLVRWPLGTRRLYVCLGRWADCYIAIVRSFKAARLDVCGKTVDDVKAFDTGVSLRLPDRAGGLGYCYVCKHVFQGKEFV